jgi:hypothetical protein
MAMKFLRRSTIQSSGVIASAGIPEIDAVAI